MLSLLFLAAIVAALPVAIEGASSQDSEAATSQFAKRIATALEEVGQRSACDLGGDGLPNECHVNSVLRAAFALLCVFLFLVALHVWQAAKYNKIGKLSRKEQTNKGIKFRVRL